MYETFYGLKEKPFTLLPDPDYLYLSPKHLRALTLLEYGMMNQAGFSVICGDTGAGKTTLIRRLLNELGDDTRVGLITNTHQSFGELLNWVLMAFGLDGDGKSKAQMHQMFISFLIEQYAENKHTVLIVDEAQNMDADTLEELRMLSNINADKDQVLQVILAGQPALRETLRKPELMQFAQRIAVDYYLESLSAEETRAYIHHRLKIAGTTNTIFTNTACEAIYKYSGGTPRLINLLCDTALVYGFAEQSDIIDEKLVHDVVREQHSNSIIPTFNTDHSKSNLTSASSEAEPAVEQSNEGAGPDGHESGQHEKIEAKLTGLENAVNLNTAIEKEVEKAIEEKADELAAKVTSEQIPSDSQGAESSGSDSSGSESSNQNSTEQAVKQEESVDQQTSGSESTSQEPHSDETLSSASKAQKEATKDDEIEFDDAELEGLEVAAAADDLLGKEAQETEKKTPSQDKVSQEDEQPVVNDPLNSGAERPPQKNQDDEDVYPIVHIEENPRKGLNIIIVGVAAGMFVASIVMMIAAWMMFGGNDIHDERGTQQSISTQKEAEQREMKALQKERDAALAVSRALEMERDAALISAKAKDEMRAAEQRAAEILAEQQRKAEKLLEQANARARAAKKAEEKAVEREKELQRLARMREIELEAQRQSILRKEKWRREKMEREAKAKAQLEAKAEREARAQRETQARDARSQQEKLRIATQQKEKTRESQSVKVKKEKSRESFSANPCNSPSAKFLSTCKK